jgi:cell shape-determining protein MreC
MMEWCELTDEVSCREFLRDKIHPKGIRLGDFVKVVLKISAMAREFAAGVEEMIRNNDENSTNSQALKALLKLSQIDGLILKFVATNQSLYI